MQEMTMHGAEPFAMQVLSDNDIDAVSGGIIIAPVVWKIGAWAVGAAFGAGLVIAVHKSV